MRPRQCKICHRYEAMLTKEERAARLKEALAAITAGQVPPDWDPNVHHYFAIDKRNENWAFVMGYLESTIRRLVADDNGLCFFCGRDM